MSRRFQTRYTLTFDDFRALNTAFNRLTWARRICRHIGIWVGILMIAGGAYSMWGLNDWPLAVYFLALATFLLVLQFVIVPWQQRKSFEHQRLGDYEVEMEADGDGFFSRSEIAEGRQKWAGIRQVDDLPEHVILWPNNRLGWIVPKHAFTSKAEADAFAQFAKEKTAGQKL